MINSSIEPNSRNPKREFGLLSVSMLIGIGGGFASHDLYAGLNGYDGFSPYYVNQTVNGMIFGCVAGIAIGWILDACVANAETREMLQKCLWVLLCIGFILFWLFRPALHNART